MAISEHASGTRTTGTPPEASFTALGTGGDTTDEVFQLFIDCNNMVNGDTIEVQCLEKAISSGTARMIWEITVTNAQDEPMFVSPTLILMHSWTFQMKQLSGSARTFDWSIRKVA
jgi:hypothetical protein